MSIWNIESSFTVKHLEISQVSQPNQINMCIFNGHLTLNRMIIFRVPEMEKKYSDVSKEINLHKK